MILIRILILIFQKKMKLKSLKILKVGRVKNLKIGNKNLSGVEARTIFGLKSAKFSVELNGDEIKFSVIGYGHGVGLSQCGSDSLAKERKKL